MYISIQCSKYNGQNTERAVEAPKRKVLRDCCVEEPTFEQLNGKLEVAKERAQGEGAFEVIGKKKERREKTNCVHGMARVTCGWSVVEEYQDPGYETVPAYYPKEWGWGAAEAFVHETERDHIWFGTCN